MNGNATAMPFDMDYHGHIVKVSLVDLLIVDCSAGRSKAYKHFMQSAVGAAAAADAGQVEAGDRAELADPARAQRMTHSLLASLNLCF